MKKAQNNSETLRIHVIRDDNGHLLNEENNVKAHWMNNFESIFTCKDTVAYDKVITTECTIDDRNESEIMMDEIMKALKRMKVGKAAGYDRVSSDMLRGGEDIVACRESASLPYQLFNKC
ncbi:hypothetical protein EVAR_17371_1 [Eumeta japonica]|uniref:Craniofacial development protein 2 n=1 Tax=Eumeta variegata TaxID=151549 RepID=A0A4C1WGZ0_EUMVA|nr:hypothetical protein EVAR_17371_1 [Eumeta japonica]